MDKQELEDQEARLVSAMKDIEGQLSDEQHEKITRVLLELTAYDIMRMMHEIQTERLRRKFGS